MYVKLINDRPSAETFSSSEVLQDFTKATNVRLRFLRTKTLLAQMMQVQTQDPSVTRRVRDEVGAGGEGGGWGGDWSPDPGSVCHEG